MKTKQMSFKHITSTELFLENLKNVKETLIHKQFLKFGFQNRYISKCFSMIKENNGNYNASFLQNENLDEWRFYIYSFGFELIQPCLKFEDCFYWNKIDTCRCFRLERNVYIKAFKIEQGGSVETKKEMNDVQEIQVLEKEYQNNTIDNYIVKKSLFSFNGEFMKNDSENWRFTVKDSNGKVIHNNQPFHLIGYWVSECKMFFHLYTQEENCTVIGWKIKKTLEQPLIEFETTKDNSSQTSNVTLEMELKACQNEIENQKRVILKMGNVIIELKNNIECDIDELYEDIVDELTKITNTQESQEKYIEKISTDLSSEIVVVEKRLQQNIKKDLIELQDNISIKNKYQDNEMCELHNKIDRLELELLEAINMLKNATIVI